MWLRKNGFCSVNKLNEFESTVPVLSTTMMSDAGHPAVRYDTTACWRIGQFRVNPMKSGVEGLPLGEMLADRIGRSLKDDAREGKFSRASSKD